MSIQSIGSQFLSRGAERSSAQQFDTVARNVAASGVEKRANAGQAQIAERIGFSDKIKTLGSAFLEQAKTNPAIKNALA